MHAVLLLIKATPDVRTHLYTYRHRKRGGGKGVAPIDFWFNREFGMQIWSKVKVKILV